MIDTTIYTCLNIESYRLDKIKLTADLKSDIKPVVNCGKEDQQKQN